MIEQYINRIITMDILADSITIIDDKGIIRYIKIFHKTAIPVNPPDIVGKHFMDAFPYIKSNESTVLKALMGQATFFQPFSKYGSTHIMESVYPIKIDEKIIGAVCISYNSEKTIDSISIQPPKKKIASFSINDIIGKSQKIRHLKMQIAQLAKTDVSVMIYGETGTGKEMVAHAIHNMSPRRNRQFFSQNCAAIPESLAESLFFGTKKGIYTGSVDSPGILEQVNKGTMFFDEINSLNYSVQGKLLRVLESKKIQRLGSEKEIPVDFRIISALNEDPFQAVEQGKIRSDLFYRLGTIILEIPPLRDRPEDIPYLTEHFIQIHNEDSIRQFNGVSDEVAEIFSAYPWPGNVRELKNVIASAIVFARSPVIQKSNLPTYILKYLSDNDNRHTLDNVSLYGFPRKYSEINSMSEFIDNLTKADVSYKEALEQLESAYFAVWLKKCPNQTLLSSNLKISRKTLSVKLKKYGLRPCDSEDK